MKAIWLSDEACSEGLKTESALAEKLVTKNVQILPESGSNLGTCGQMTKILPTDMVTKVT